MERNLRRAHPHTWSFHQITTRSSLLLPAVVDSQPSPSKEYPEATLLRLPDSTPLTSSFAEVVAQRASARSFSDHALPAAAVATILAVAYGVRGRREFGGLEVLDRSVPSAGGLYPLELYVIALAVEGLRPGVYHYQPLLHALEFLRPLETPRPLIAQLFMGQPYVARAAAVVVLTAVFERTLRKYGDRGYRYLLLEAGHVGQNLQLAAVALNLGALSVGGFFDQELGAFLALDGDEEAPIYATAVGHVDRDGNYERDTTTPLR